MMASNAPSRNGDGISSRSRTRSMLGLRTNAAVGPDHRHAGQRRPGITVGPGLEQSQEGALALVVDGEVDLRVGAQKGFGLVGHVRPAEHDDNAGLQGLQPTRDFERDSPVPDVSGEADQIGVLQRLDRVGDAHALVERRQELIACRIGGELLHIGLQQRDRVRQIVLAGERVIDLDKADLDRAGDVWSVSAAARHPGGFSSG